jgi:hypothetical protein
MRKLAHQKHTFVSVLLHRLLRSRLKDLAAFVAGTDAAAFISPEGSAPRRAFRPNSPR